MINLLPDEIKKDIRAGRMNIILLRYNFFTLIAILLVIGLCGMFYLFLNFSQADAIQTNTENDKRVAELQSIKDQADAYRKDLSTAKSVLSKSFNYTDIVFAITKLVPDDVVLSSINIESGSFDKPVVFSAHAKNFDSATQLKENFQNSYEILKLDEAYEATGMFTDVFLQNLTDASGVDGAPEYPVSFTISAVIKKVVGLW